MNLKSDLAYINKTSFLAIVKTRLKIGSYFLFFLAFSSLFAVDTILAAEGGQFGFLTYGTLGFSHDDNMDLATVRDLSQRPRKEGLTNDSWVMDSRLGLQTSYQFNSLADFMAQVVWREQEGTSLDSYLDWAFINLHPISEVDVRLGRVGYDVFLMSDHRHLGYAYPWVRPPVEFYGWVPMYAVDGGDIVYTLEDGPARWRFKAQAGHAGLKFPTGPSSYDFKSDEVWSLTAGWELNAWRIKGGYSHIVPRTDAPLLAPLQAGLETVAKVGVPGVSAEAFDLRGELTYKDASLHYVTLGAAYDDGTWIAQGELARVTTSADMVSNGNMAYAGIGRRFGNWTPFALLSGVRSNVPVRQGSADWSILGPSGPGLQAVAVSTLNSTRFNQETESLGLRWDYNSHVAFKTQWDSTMIHPDGYGLWYRVENDTVTKHTRVNMISFTMDFLF